MSDMKHLRKQLFIDSKVQGALALRVVLYWIFCLITITIMLLCWRILTGPARLFYTHFNDMWFFYGPAFIASFLLLPLVVVDIIRFSNRFTGPLMRLRRSMRALARGERVEPVRFRDDDYWHDFAEEFNELLARVQGDNVQGDNVQGDNVQGDSSAAESEQEDEPVPVAAE